MTARKTSFLSLATDMVTSLLLCLILLSFPAHSETAMGGLNIPQVFSANVTLGMIQADIPVPVSGADNLQFQVIAPIDGVTLTVIDPANHAVFVPNDPNVSFLPGSELQPTPAPGGQFITPVVPSPANGTWILRLRFPSAPEKTVIMATVFIESRYQAGIVFDGQRHNKGEQIAIGLLAVDNGIPIGSLSPTITVIAPDGQTRILSPLDNGDLTNWDDLANDGLYSVGYTFDQVGQYQINGTVAIPAANGNILRTATAFVDVVESPVSLAAVTFTKNTGPGACLAGVDVVLGLSVLQNRHLVGVAKLKASNGRIIEESRDASLAVGSRTITIPFTAKQIQSLSIDGPYSIDVDMLDFSGIGALIALRQPDAASLTGISLGNLCRPPIEVKQPLTITPVLKDGFVGSLKFSFVVNVIQSGSYQFSFKLLGSGGEDIGVISFSQSLSAGDNAVQADVAADKFLKANGPYKAVSLLVVGGQSSARLAELGSSGNLERWQFYPRIVGDLDNDGDIDVADRNLLLSFRGVKPLSPGDRRDINKDGSIDVRDGRTITTLVCQTGRCPVNP